MNLTINRLTARVNVSINGRSISHMRQYRAVSSIAPQNRRMQLRLLPRSPSKVMGGYVFAGVGIYVCEQLPGTNSSPIVTKPGQSYH